MAYGKCFTWQSKINQSLSYQAGRCGAASPIDDPHINERQMAFESLSFYYEVTIKNFPPEWLPLTYLYDPDLPLFPIHYFHILDPNLQAGHRPGERDRLFGFIHHVNLDGTELTVSAVINKDVKSAQFSHYISALESEIKARLGLGNPVTFADIDSALKGALAPANGLVKELWYQVIDGSFGKTLPFGGMWDEVMGLVRFVASWNSAGGRKGELIQTHCFASEFGVKIQTGGGIHVDYFLLPTFSEITDVSNPLSHFPKFSMLAQAADEFVSKYCGSVIIGNHRFSAFELPKVGAGRKLKTDVVLKIIEQASASYRKALFENYSAFDRGPQRSIIFLLMLHDLRCRLWNASAITPEDCGLLYTKLKGTYQTPKVISLYAQQCFGNEFVLPIDNWVRTFLDWPLDFRSAAPMTFYSDLFACSNKWGKLERLIWVAAQARKVHSSVCKEILWCVRYGDREERMRGANPFACKICETHVRNVCPSFARIANEGVSFNAASRSAMGGALFNVKTSAGNNTTGGQTFESCEAKAIGTSDIYSTHDRPEQFEPYPQSGHTGNNLTVQGFIQEY